MLFQEIDSKSNANLGSAFHVCEGDKLSYVFNIDNSSSAKTIGHFQKAKHCLDSEEYTDAKQHIDLAIALDPKCADHYCCRADILIALYSGKLPLFLQKLGEILTDINDALEIDPNHAEAIYMKGIVQYYFLDKEKEGLYQIGKAASLGHIYAQVIYDELRDC